MDIEASRKTDPQTERCIHFVSEILDLLKSTHRYERVFHFVVDRLVRLYRCQTCAIVHIDPKTEYLRIANSHGLSLSFHNEFRKRLATGAVGELLWTGKPILVRDSAADAELSEQVRLEHPFGSCAAVQILTDHRSLGYLYVDSEQPGAFREKDLEVLRAFADIAGIAYQKCELYEENLRLETVDKEVGVEKYGAFLENLRTNFERAQTMRKPLHLLLLDVDNFKDISHTYGGEASLEMLRHIARLAKSQKQYVDGVARYGADEFVVLLANIDVEGAVAYAHGLRKSVEDSWFTRHKFRSTVSVGISSFPQNALTVEDLVKTAKNALFEAQRAGRNKIFYFLKEWYSAEAVVSD